MSNNLDNIKPKYSNGIKRVDEKISEITNNSVEYLYKAVNIRKTMSDSGDTSVEYTDNNPYDSMRHQWIDYGNNYKNNIKSAGWKWDWSWNDESGPFTNIKTLFQEIGNNINGTVAKETALAALQAIGMSVSQGASIAIAEAPKKIEDVINTLMGGSENFTNNLSEMLNNISGLGDRTVNSTIGAYIQNGLSLMANENLSSYDNGTNETSYGKLMSKSWNKGGSLSFSKLLNNTSGKSVVFLNSTPLDSGYNKQNVYGNMLLGAPPIFTHITDPRNRTLAETIIRDAKFLTLVPGFPKFNGSNLLMSAEKGQYGGTLNKPEKMIDYLLKNGIDSEIAGMDKRYYTFQHDYDEYYAYLETMLNTIWIKMGLGTTNNPNEYKMFTFFNDINNDMSLKNQYKTGIGFFVNPSGSITENISNDKTSLGSEQAGMVNAASETYQNINFLSGMGTGGAVRNAAVKAMKASALLGNVKSLINDVLENTVGVWTSGESILKKAVLSVPAVIKDTIKVSTEKDAGAIMQTFAVTNGMKVVYPELWSDSTVSRSINFNFEFTSPYGDPLSIFQYVMVPFCALLAFAMPRQAADNGYVSPFFIRSDIPGLFTSDFGIISDFSWTRGGSNDLWTKDGLPRAISGSFSIADLYPYLAMTKRISFLSANPNYTSFLDSLSGLHAVKISDQNAENALNEYWKTMLSRVTGDGNQKLFNNYSQASKISHNNFGDSLRRANIGGSTKNNKNISWLR